jgi:hypothetical protein
MRTVMVSLWQRCAEDMIGFDTDRQEACRFHTELAIQSAKKNPARRTGFQVFGWDRRAYSMIWMI